MYSSIRKRVYSWLLPGLLIVSFGAIWNQGPPPFRGGDLTQLLNDKELQRVGERIFFDSDLSEPSGQSCAACHSPEVGWTGPDEELNKAGAVYRGAIHSRFGNRKPNTSAYATLVPPFQLVQQGEERIFVGGNFWDGRATGEKLGSPAADQAQGPFLNPVEQNNPDAATVVGKICRSDYAAEFRKAARRLWGVDEVCEVETETAYTIVAIAIAAFEHSAAVNKFSSKYDLFLEGKAPLSALEKKGLELFEGKGKCARCHVTTPGPNGEPPLFTDHTYDNIGIPRNPDNPWYNMPAELNPEGENWIDPGLGGFLKEVPKYADLAEENLGKHRVPTLRNVDLRPRTSFVKAYGHNGFFKSLEAVVHFYNTRDVLPPQDKVIDPKPGVNCWPRPEVSKNLNETEMGALGLTLDEEEAIIAFMKTLSDGYEGKIQ